MKFSGSISGKAKKIKAQAKRWVSYNLRVYQMLFILLDLTMIQETGIS